MKNFFKKLNKGQDTEQDDLNLDYGDFYSGKGSSEPEAPHREAPASEHSAGGYYDVPKPVRGGYEEPDFQSENTRYYDGGDHDAERSPERVVEHPVARPVERVPESVVRPRETWQESDAPGFRPAQPVAEAAPAAPAVFTPSPAPEYLYFTPSTYRDCREGIVKGMATGHVVVVRLRNLEAGDVLRLFDYMMGAVLALEGELIRPAATTVVLVPKDVELDENELEPDEEDEEDEEDYESEEDEDEYVEDTYENGEYGSFDEEDDDAEEYEEEEYEDEEYEDEEYEDEEYEDEEYEDEEYEDEEYEDEEYEDEEYEDEEYEDEEYEEEEYEDEEYEDEEYEDEKA